MSALFAVVRAVEGVIGIVTATGRLLRADRQTPRSVPPTPLPIGDNGALSYLEGANDMAWRLQERERLRRSGEELARKVAADGEWIEHKSEPPPLGHVERRRVKQGGTT